MKAMYIILVIVAAAGLYLLFSKAFGNGSEVKLPQAYAGYQSIDSVKTVQSGTTELSLLFESEENIQSYLTKDNHVIIYTVHGKQDNRFYKIATSGEVVDSLKIGGSAGDLAFVKGYIIDKENSEYYKWSFNGDRNPIKIQAENTGLNWDAGRQKSKITDIKASAGQVYIDYRFQSPVPKKAVEGEIQTTQPVISFAVLSYFTGDGCFQLYTNLDISKQFPWSYTQQLLWNNLFKRIDDRSAHDGQIIPSPAVKYRYFHRLEKEKVRFSGGGGNASGFTKVLYPGYLFSDIAFEKDTIKIKEFMYLDPERPSTSVKIDGNQLGTFSKNKTQPIEKIDGYMYFTNDQLQYALFANSDQKIYQIRKKT